MVIHCWLPPRVTCSRVAMLPGRIFPSVPRIGGVEACHWDPNMVPVRPTSSIPRTRTSRRSRPLQGRMRVRLRVMAAMPRVMSSAPRASSTTTTTESSKDQDRNQGEQQDASNDLPTPQMSQARSCLWLCRSISYGSSRHMTPPYLFFQTDLFFFKGGTKKFLRISPALCLFRHDLRRRQNALSGTKHDGAGYSPSTYHLVGLIAPWNRYLFRIQCNARTAQRGHIR